MVIYLTAALSGLLIVLFLIRVRKVFFTLVVSSIKLLDTLLVKDQSDVKLIVSLQLKVFKSLLFVILILIGCVILYQAPIEIWEYFGVKVDAGWQYILALSLGTVIPFIPWKKKKSVIIFQKTI